MGTTRQELSVEAAPMAGAPVFVELIVAQHLVIHVTHFDCTEVQAEATGSGQHLRHAT
jgi:hypothetical protein